VPSGDVHNQWNILASAMRSKAFVTPRVMIVVENTNKESIAACATGPAGARGRYHTRTYLTEILKRHMVDKVPVSDLCNEEDLQPSVFYTWQRQAVENLAGASSTPADEGPSKREKELVAKTKELEAKLAKEDNVIAEVAAELVATKKLLECPEQSLGAP